MTATDTQVSTTPVEWPLHDFLLGPPRPAGLLPAPRPDPDSYPDSYLDQVLDRDPEQEDSPLAWTLARNDIVRAEDVIDKLSNEGRRATNAAVAQAIEQALQIDLGALISSAWRSHRALTDAARRTLARPGSEDIVELATHTITSEHRPYVDLLVDRVLVARISLEITVEFTLHAVLAVIRDGRLLEVRAGHGELSATVSAEGIQILSRQGDFNLRAHHRFRHPMPLIAEAAA